MGGGSGFLSADLDDLAVMGSSLSQLSLRRLARWFTQRGNLPSPSLGL